MNRTKELIKKVAEGDDPNSALGLKEFGDEGGDYNQEFLPAELQELCAKIAKKEENSVRKAMFKVLPRRFPRLDIEVFMDTLGVITAIR